MGTREGFALKDAGPAPRTLRIHSEENEFSEIIMDMQISRALGGVRVDAPRTSPPYSFKIQEISAS